MAKSLCIWEFNRPTDAGDAAHDLPIDEIAYPPDSKNKCRRYRECISDVQE
jgi:hypothetical protein